MKKLKAVCLAVFIFIVAVNSFATVPPQSEAAVNAIRREYAAINKRVSRYRKVKKELSGYSLEGGDLTAYFSGPAIVKMVANHYGESGSAVEEYYYSNEKLIFVYRKDFSYDRPMSGKVIATRESRFYYSDDRLIRWLGAGGKQMPTGSTEFEEKQKEFLEASSGFRKGALLKGRVIEAP